MTNLTHHLLAQVDALFVIVRRVQRRDAPDALGAEPRPGAVGAPPVERHPHNGHVVFPDEAGILDVRRLEEGVDPGEVRKLPPRERRDRLVVDGRRAGQAVDQGLGDLAIEVRAGDIRLLQRRPPPLGVRGVEGIRVVLTPLRLLEQFPGQRRGAPGLVDGGRRHDDIIHTESEKEYC